jgi:DNA replication protein DnaC
MNEVEAKMAGDIKHGYQELSDAFFECPKHGMYHGKPVKFSWGGGTVILKPECLKCADERKLQEANEEARRKRQDAIVRLEMMNIGKNFWASAFENFDAYNDELKHHLEVAKQFAERPEGKLVMIGENGNGKNHLAASILKKTGGFIYTCYEIGVILRDCYNGFSSEAEFFNRVCNAPLLIIDEVDKIKETEAKHNWMSYIVGKRYNNMLPTIFIANGHLQDDCKSLEKPCAKCLEHHLGNDVISRIFEDGISLKFTSEDYRYRIRANKRKPA